MRKDATPGRDLGSPVETTTSLAKDVRNDQPEERLYDNPVALPSGVLYQLRSAMGRPSPKIRAEYVDEIRHIANSGVRPIVSVVNHKSGTKTTNALQLASMISMLTGWRVYVIPATLNTKTATLAAMAGITDGTSIRELSDMVQTGRIKNYQTLSAVASFTKPPHNVGIFLEDLTSNMVINEEGEAARTPYGTAEFQTLMRTCYPHADMWVFDHGNDDVETGSIGHAAVQMSDTIVLPALSSSPHSLTSAKRTFLDYQPDVYAGLTENQVADRYRDGLNIMPGELIATRDKLSRSTLMMSGVNRYSREEFANLVAPTSERYYQYHRDHPITWSGVGLPMPGDRSVTKKDWVCDLDRLGPRTYDAVLALSVATLRDAAETQRMAHERLAAMREGIQASLDSSGKQPEDHPTDSAVRHLGTSHASA